MLYAVPRDPIRAGSITDQYQEVTLVERDQEFVNLNLSLDGGTYVGCTFKNCNLIYSGLLPATFDNCQFAGCIWDFGGPAANTLAFMRMLHQAGGDVKDQIEDVIGKVRAGA